MHLEHILTHISLIQQFSATIDFEGYQADIKTRLAVERLMQNLAEDAFRLGDHASVLCPAVDWRGIRGMGNRLRHNYDLLIDQTIWASIQNDILPIKIAVEDALRRLKPLAKGPSL